MSKIDDEMLEYIGILAKLDVSLNKEKIKEDMERMLNYVNILNELDTDGVEPLVQVIETNNVFRDDVIINGDNKDEMMKNAPKTKEGQYVVPRTF